MSPAPALDCTDCGHTIGRRWLHFLTDTMTDVLCIHCAERRRPHDGPYRAATRAAAANLLGVWP